MLNLIDLTIKQLKSLAKSYEFTGYSKLRKNDLIELINNHTNQLGLGKKHKKFLKREERKKDEEYKRIEAKKRQKIEDEKEQKKVNLAEEKLVKEKKDKDKRKSKRKNNEKRQHK